MLSANENYQARSEPIKFIAKLNPIRSLINRENYEYRFRSERREKRGVCEVAHGDVIVMCGFVYISIL